MNSILAISVFWTFYGVLGLFGIQIIPDKYKNKTWTKKYKRYCGISWILLGVPWLILCAIFAGKTMYYQAAILIYILATIPCIAFSFFIGKKFNAMIKEKTENNH